ncbi:MAG: hypothetical protein V5A27_10855 [Halapricum sp.]
MTGCAVANTRCLIDERVFSRAYTYDRYGFIVPVCDENGARRRRTDYNPYEWTDQALYRDSSRFPTNVDTNN